MEGLTEDVGDKETEGDGDGDRDGEGEGVTDGEGAAVSKRTINIWGAEPTGILGRRATKFGATLRFVKRAAQNKSVTGHALTGQQGGDGQPDMQRI